MRCAVFKCLAVGGMGSGEGEGDNCHGSIDEMENIQHSIVLNSQFCFFCLGYKTADADEQKE